MSEVRIVAVGEPVPQGSHRVVTNPRTQQSLVIESNPRLRAWRRTVKVAAKAVMGDERPFVRPVTVDITFRLLRPRTIQDRVYPCVEGSGDLDKLVRAIFDAITKVAIYTDALVVGLNTRKLYAEKEPPGVTIIVKEVGA